LRSLIRILDDFAAEVRRRYGAEVPRVAHGRPGEAATERQEGGAMVGKVVVEAG
jgi:hypothetical protein